MDINHRRRELHFLMPFIDFAFMVIIIFAGLLSMAYFDPPGSAGVKREKSLFTDKDIKEFQKMGLTPSQIRELVVIRRERHKKLQDTRQRTQLKTDVVKKTLAQMWNVKRNIKPAGGQKKENSLLEKKAVWLEKKLAQMKKQMAVLEAGKKAVKKTISKKDNQPPVKETNGKDSFGGHEFLDLRK